MNMDLIIQLVKNIMKCTLLESNKVAQLVGKLQGLRDSMKVECEPDLAFFGLACGLEKISDHKVYVVRDDKKLDDLNNKINEIKEREGLDRMEEFVHGHPDTPEDYQSLSIEFDYRIDEITSEIMKEFGEKNISDLFMGNRKEYIRRYYKGWRILEKDNPEKLRQIDEDEKERLKEYEL
jgi:hypothetical protein